MGMAMAQLIRLVSFVIVAVRAKIAEPALREAVTAERDTLRQREGGRFRMRHPVDLARSPSVG